MLIIIFYIILKLLDEEKRSQFVATQLEDLDDYAQQYVVHDVEIRVRYFTFCLFSLFLAKP